MGPFNFGNNFLEEQTEAIQNLEERLLVTSSLEKKDIKRVLDALFHMLKSKTSASEYKIFFGDLALDKASEETLYKIIQHFYTQDNSLTLPNSGEEFHNHDSTLIKVFAEWVDENADEYDMSAWYETFSMFSHYKNENSEKTSQLVELEEELDDHASNSSLHDRMEDSFDGVNIVVPDVATAELLHLPSYTIDKDLQNNPSSIDIPKIQRENAQFHPFVSYKMEKQDQDVKPSLVIEQEAQKEMSHEPSREKRENTMITEPLGIDEIANLQDKEHVMSFDEIRVEKESFVSDNLGDDIMQDFDTADFSTPEPIINSNIVSEDLASEERNSSIEDLPIGSVEKTHEFDSMKLADKIVERMMEKMSQKDIVKYFLEIQSEIVPHLLKSFSEKIMNENFVVGLSSEEVEQLFSRIVQESSSTLETPFSMDHSVQTPAGEHTAHQESIGMEKNTVVSPNFSDSHLEMTEDIAPESKKDNKWWKNLPALQYGQEQDFGSFFMIRDLG